MNSYIFFRHQIKSEGKILLNKQKNSNNYCKVNQFSFGIQNLSNPLDRKFPNQFQPTEYVISREKENEKNCVSYNTLIYLNKQ